MKYLILCTVLTFGFASHSQAETPPKLDGTWQVAGVSCANGEASEFLKKNDVLYKSGEGEETLTVSGSHVENRFRAWGSGKSGYCVQRADETWEIANSDIRVVNRKIIPVPNSKCPQRENLLGQTHRYELHDDLLKIYGASGVKNAAAVCKTSAIVWSYSRIH